MSDREVKLKFGWFNIFNLGGALYGWCHTHTWEGVAWGYVGGTVLPPLIILGTVLFCLVGAKMIDALPAPKVRIADDVTEDQSARWEREYSQHCRENNLPNELRTCVRQDLYYAEAESISRTTSGGGPG